MSSHAYTIILEPEAEGGYSVFVPALTGCFSQGDTLEEAMVNIQEAITAYIESLQQEGLPIPSDIPSLHDKVLNVA